jgi:flagellar hook-associated protein 1 FlgK
MTISSALSNALSGLAASARSAGVVSTNLANVLTEGYAPRDIELRARSSGAGGGVLVGGVQRNVNTALLGERRLADSEVSLNRVLVDVSTTLEKAIGIPDEEGSLSARISAMEASLVTAAARPDENVRLRDVMFKAGDVAEKFNKISATIQEQRTKLDDRIGATVESINTILAKTERLNGQIARSHALGHDVAALEDQRQLLIDELATHVPVRLAARDSGAVAIYTPGGAALLDGKAAQLGFARSNVVAPHMTLENGLLSGLEINGIPVRTDGARSPVAGGGLAALFEARDGVAPAAQARIDGLARDLVERFQQPGLDSTRAPGQPGLFTDMQAVFDPADEIGIAGRIALNTAVDEAAEGAVWRLRDGLGADTPANAGDATLLQVLSDSLSRPAPPASAALDAGSASLAAHIGAVTSSMGQSRLSAEQDLGFANSLQAGLKESELAQGVDTDEQLQRLLLVEQAYAANARMIQTMEDLLDTLIRI